MRHQGLGDTALQMGLPARIVREAVENAERPGIEADRVPGDCRGFGFNQGQRARQELGEGFFFARLGLQFDKKAILWSCRLRRKGFKGRNAPARHLPGEA